MSETPLDTSSADDPGDVPTGHAARAAGERLRGLADDEAARVEADEAAELERVATLAEARHAELDHPLRRLGAEPFTDEVLGRLGELAAGYAPCPFCDGFGAVDPDGLLAALPEVVARLAPYPPSSVFVRCDECDGWGSVLTGGRTGDKGIQPCPVCGSHGYLDTRETARVTPERVDGREYVAPAPAGDGRDPFTVAPPEGVAPAAGMEWNAELGLWGYPPRVQAHG